MKKETGSTEANQEEPQQGSPWVNIGKLVFLIAVLVAAWFILDRLIGE